MANNRMYLQCAGCGAKLYLGKHVLDGYHGVPDNIGELLTEFYDKHAWCNERGLDCFRITYDFGSCNGEIDGEALLRSMCPTYNTAYGTEEEDGCCDRCLKEHDGVCSCKIDGSVINEALNN